MPNGASNRREHALDRAGVVVDGPHRSCHIEAPAKELTELRRRLLATHWPGAQTADDWSQGVPLLPLRELIAHRANEYDWRRHERRLNAYPQRLVRVDGIDIHVLQAVSPHPGAVPVLMTHGRPSSVVEFLGVLPRPLDPGLDGADPAGACTVICPSLLGFGFSAHPAEQRPDVHRIARAWSTLMRELGYERYAAQGGDWGSAIGTSMAQRQPEPILGLHLTMHFGGVTERPHAGSRASRLLAELAARTRVDTEHHAQLSQFPQTVGYGLTDSPVALAAWLRQRFGVWADCDGDLFATIDRDDLLTNLMLYWLPHAGASSGRIYWESRRVLSAPVRVATGFSLFAKGFPYPSWRSIPDNYQNVVWWRTVARGGHFPAWEQPDAFVTELRGFLAHVARPVRS